MKKPSGLTFNFESAQKQLEEMHAYISKSNTKALLWYFNKTMRKAVRGLYVDTIGVERVKDLINGNNHVVLIPLYKSFGDFFTMQFINYKYGIESGFTFGNADDTPRLGGMKLWQNNDHRT